MKKVWVDARHWNKDKKQQNANNYRTLAASMALATVMNCCGETDLSSQRLRKMWRDPDLRFDISTPLLRVWIFHPWISSLLHVDGIDDDELPNLLFESEADNNSCMQLSLANWTYLLRESSLMDLLFGKQNKQIKLLHVKTMYIVFNMSERQDQWSREFTMTDGYGCKPLLLDWYCSLQGSKTLNFFFPLERN